VYYGVNISLFIALSASIKAPGVCNAHEPGVEASLSVLFSRREVTDPLPTATPRRTEQPHSALPARTRLRCCCCRDAFHLQFTLFRSTKRVTGITSRFGHSRPCDQPGSFTSLRFMCAAGAFADCTVPGQGSCRLQWIHLSQRSLKAMPKHPN
jgi:hypothetical protein